jgi:hypothetical protein
MPHPRQLWPTGDSATYARLVQACAHGSWHYPSAACRAASATCAAASRATGTRNGEQET